MQAGVAGGEQGRMPTPKPFVGQRFVEVLGSIQQQIDQLINFTIYRQASRW
jgi:hypothetical protein